MVHTDLFLDNYGMILSSEGPALWFTELSTGTIINEASGYINGKHGVSILFQPRYVVESRHDQQFFGTESGKRRRTSWRNQQ
jgi:hypothetical protein